MARHHPACARPPRGVRFRTTYGAFVSSIGANAILPARVGAALRVGVVRRNVPGSSVVTIAATIVLETAIEVAFGAAVIAVVLLAGSSLHPSGSAPALSGLATHPVVLAVIACFLLAALVLGGAYRRQALALLARMAQGFSIVRSPRAFVSRVLSWKLVAWALRLGSVYAFLVAFHVPAAPWTALAVVAAQNVAASVPLLPGNAGTQQAAIGVALAGSASAAVSARIRRRHAGGDHDRRPAFSVRRRSRWWRAAKTCATRSERCGVGRRAPAVS